MRHLFLIAFLIYSQAFGATDRVLNTTSILFKEPGSGANTISVTAPASFSSNYQLTLPTAVGISGQVIATNASGALSWITAALAASADVTGPATSVSGSMAVFNDTTGKKLSQYSPTSGGILFGTSSGAVSESASSLSWDSSTSRLQVGGGANTLTINGSTSGSNLTVSSQGGSNTYEVGIHRHNASTNPGIYLARSRGSEASPSIVQSGDLLGVMDGLGFDGTDYEIGAQIDYVVDGTPGSNDMPGAILFKTTPDGSATPATAAVISNDKTLNLYGTLKTALTVSGIVTTGTSGIISSISAVPVSYGGTGSTSFTANSLITGNGQTAFNSVAVGTSGTVLTSNGISWYAASVAGTGDVVGPASAVSGALSYYGDTTGKVIKSLTAVGTSGQYLKSEGSSTTPVWTNLLNGVVNIVTKTTTYTATTADDIITVSTGSAWTLTLYAASGNAGRVLRIKKTSSDLNALTIDGNASETIDGSTTTTINTQYEELAIVCDGSNWHILSRTYPQAWVAYTPTFAGFGTPTSVNVFSRRVGDSLQLRGTLSTGTVTATIASITLGYNGTNANVSLDTGKVASGITHIGQWASGTTTNNYQDNVLVDASETGVIKFGYQNATQAGLTALAGNVAFGNSQGISFFATIPISGWK